MERDVVFGAVGLNLVAEAGLVVLIAGEDRPDHRQPGRHAVAAEPQQGVDGHVHALAVGQPPDVQDPEPPLEIRPGRDRLGRPGDTVVEHS